MRLFIAFLLLGWSLQASAYTIDFEEFSPGTSAPLTSGDYEITAWGDTAVVLAGNNLQVSTAPDFFPFFAEVTVARTDGGAFAAHSMDVLSAIGNGQIYGETVLGDSIIGNLADLGTGDWLNLVSFSYNVSQPAGTPLPALLLVDNIVVSAVPIPAAVWLFGSALGFLGWMRRSK